MTVKQKINNHYSNNIPRVIGDLALVMIPVFQTIISSAPGVNDHVKYWIGAILTTALVLVKFISKLWQSN